MRWNWNHRFVLQNETFLLHYRCEILKRIVNIIQFVSVCALLMYCFAHCISHNHFSLKSAFIKLFLAFYSWTWFMKNFTWLNSWALFTLLYFVKFIFSWLKKITKCVKEQTIVFGFRIPVAKVCASGHRHMKKLTLQWCVVMTSFIKWVLRFTHYKRFE